MYISQLFHSDQQTNSRNQRDKIDEDWKSKVAGELMDEESP